MKGGAAERRSAKSHEGAHSRVRPGAFHLVLLLVLSQSALAQSGPEPQAFLQRHAAFSKADLAAVDRGHAVARLLKTSRKTELAAAGVVRVRVPLDDVVARFRKIEEFKQGREVLAIGRFSSAPTTADLASLKLGRRDLEDLRKCRIGACLVRLTTVMEEKLRRDVNWAAPDSSAIAATVYRAALVEHVLRYLSAGDQALASYLDTEPPTDLAMEVRGLLAASPFVAEYLPEFRNYLTEFPAAKVPNSESLLYWSQEKFGLKPVTSVTHVIMFRPMPEAFVAASKQIYANHYFDASLGLTAFVAAESESGLEETYVVYVNRSRTKLLGGWLGFVKRPIAEARLRKGMEDHLQAVKAKLESRNPS